MKQNTSSRLPADGQYDLHCHYFPASMPRWAEKYGTYHDFFWLDTNHAAGCAHCAWMMKGNEQFRSLSDSRLWEPEAYLEQQSQQGIDVMALSPTPQNFYYDAKSEHTHDIARFQNDAIALLQQQHPTSFYGLGTVALQDTDRACLELTRCMNELGLAGVEIATSCCGEDLDTERLLPFFETAESLGASLFVHPWYMPSAERLQPSGATRSGWGNWLLGMPQETAIAMFKLSRASLHTRFPNLRIAFAHGGGSFIWLLERMIHGACVRPEYFPEDIDFASFSRFAYYDSHTCSTESLKLLINTVGAQRVMAGSDWPYPLGVADLCQEISLLEDPALIKQILTDTPRAFLGLD